MSQQAEQAPRSWLSTHKANVILLIVSTCLSLLAVELAFRIIEPKSPPGTTYGKPIYNNSVGFRDREFAIPKPAGVYRILVLGDSFTWGVGLDVEAATPKVMEAELAQRSTTARIEVVNAAKLGYNTVEQLILLREKGLRYEPDMLVLVYNLNDIEYLPELATQQADPADVTPVVEIDPGEEITQFSHHRGLRGVIYAVERRSALVRYLVPRLGFMLRRMGLIQSVEFSWVEAIFQGFVDSNPGWIESRTALREMAAIAQAQDIPFVVAIYPLLTDLDDYQGKQAHATVLALCDELGIRCVDLLPVFENTDARSHWINYMDGHPDAEAQRMVAERLVAAIDDYLPP